MSVSYRLLSDEEQEAAIQFMARFAQRRGIDSTRTAAQAMPVYNSLAAMLKGVPHWQKYCYLALNDSNEIIAVGQWWPRWIRDIDAKPVLVGHIIHLIADPDATGQDQRRQLLDLILSAMQYYGCSFGLVLTYETQRPFYERSGWRMYPLPYRWANVRDDRIDQHWYGNDANALPYYITEFVADEAGWSKIAEIYDHYNANRPLTLIRDSAYWPSYYAHHLQTWSSLLVKVARYSPTDEIVGYVIVTTKGIAKYEAELVEIGTLAGHEQAMLSLMQAGVNAAPLLDDGVGIYLPHEPMIAQYEEYEFDYVGEQMMLDILMGGAYFDETRRLMGVPLNAAWSEQRIESLCAAPGAIFWLLDDTYRAY